MRQIGSPTRWVAGLLELAPAGRFGVALVKQREAYVLSWKQPLRVLTVVLNLCHPLLIRLYPRLSEGYNVLRGGVYRRRER